MPTAAKCCRWIYFSASFINGNKIALFCCSIKKKGGAHGGAPRTVASRCLRGISRDAVTCRGGALPAADRRRPRFSAYAARDGLTCARHRPRLYMSPLNYRQFIFFSFSHLALARFVAFRLGSSFPIPTSTTLTLVGSSRPWPPALLTPRRVLPHSCL